MRRRAGMETVELVERDDGPASDARTMPAPRRRSRRWLLVPVLVVPSRSSACRSSWRCANVPPSRRWRRSTGVVRPVDEDLRILWTLDAGTEWVPWSGLTGGVLVGLQRASDGSQALVAVDELTGERRWTTPLADAHVVTSARTRGSARSVAASPSRGRRTRSCAWSRTPYLAFRQTENVLVPSEREPDRRRGPRGRLRRGRAARCRARWRSRCSRVPSRSASPRSDGALVVTATDLLTGREPWQSVVPSAERRARRRRLRRPVHRAAPHGRRARRRDGRRRITLLDGDGGPARTVDRREQRLRGGRAAGHRRRVLAGRRGPARRRPSSGAVRTSCSPGRLARVSADDGSLPDLVLAAGSRIRAYDRSTGRELWDVGHGLSGAAVVARGRVYLSTPDGVVAIDGRTGAELWRAPVLEGPDDGRPGDRRAPPAERAAAARRAGHRDRAERLAGRRRARRVPVRRRRRGLARRPARDPARRGVRGAHAARLGVDGRRPRAERRLRTGRAASGRVATPCAAWNRRRFGMPSGRGLARAPREVAGQARPGPRAGRRRARRPTPRASGSWSPGRRRPGARRWAA